MSEPEMLKFAKAIRAMTWRELSKISEHLAAQYAPLKDSDKLDRDGVAQVLHDMAGEILGESSKGRDEIISGTSDLPDEYYPKR